MAARKGQPASWVPPSSMTNGVLGLGLGGCRVSGFRVLGFRVSGFRLGFGILGFRVWGSGGIEDFFESPGPDLWGPEKMVFGVHWVYVRGSNCHTHPRVRA